MTPEMFEALMRIMDAKIATQLARDSWDSGLHESCTEYQVIEEFKVQFVTKDGEIEQERT